MKMSSRQRISTCFTLFLSILFAISPVSGRKTFLVKEQHPVVFAPKVHRYDTSYTLGIQDYKLILDNVVQLEVGWDFIQKSGMYGSSSQPYWSFRHNTFVRQDFTFHPDLRLDDLYKGEMFIEVPKFRTNLYSQFIWFQNMQKACLEFGWTSDPIYFLLRAAFNVMECYKIVIQTFTDWEQWDLDKIRRGNLFDKCVSSVA